MGWLLVALAALPVEREEAIALAVRTLAVELSISEGRVRPEGSSAATWPDEGLGCSDQEHAPAPTPGYRVLLKTESALYRLHVGAGRAIICGKPMDPALLPLADAARKDLAQRLKVSLDAIEIEEAKTVVWPDGSLGCPKPGLVYPQVLVDGALVRLRHGGRTYDYHSGGSRPPFLCER